jgi:DNA excision repair protein ERCC-4
MLGFVREAVEQQVAQDGLTVLGEGLGLHAVLAALVRVQHAQGGGLVLLIGCADHQKRALLHDLGDSVPTPDDVTAELSIAERLARYAAGGCLFVTTRILVVDLLTQRLTANAVSGASHTAEIPRIAVH